ncbi:ATP-grasp domain-containing protein [Virgibacillus natechei]
MRKKILIIGAGFLQSFVISKAKELGYHTITIDKNQKSIGFKYADEYGVVDIVDQEACLKFAQENRIDGVMTAATDYGVLSAAYITKQMNLPGLNYEVAKVIKNKYIVRRTLFENNVDDVSQYYEISDIDELDEMSTKIYFPVMVKPCDGSGSMAARRVNSFSDLRVACDEAIKASLAGKCLIEDFVEGQEYGVESLVHNGDTFVLGVMGKYMTTPPDYAELGHFIPSQLSIEAKVKEVVQKAIKALNINFGAVNMDVLITKDNSICIVDVGVRMGGNLIGSHIIPNGTGIDYMGNLIRASVGDQIDLNASKSGANVVTRLLNLNPGKIVSLPDFNKIKKRCQVNIYHHLQIGSVIREYHNNLDGCGYVVSVAENKKEAELLAEEAKHLVDISIIRE